MRVVCGFIIFAGLVSGWVSTTPRSNKLLQPYIKHWPCAEGLLIVISGYAAAAAIEVVLDHGVFKTITGTLKEPV